FFLKKKIRRGFKYNKKTGTHHRRLGKQRGRKAKKQSLTNFKSTKHSFRRGPMSHPNKRWCRNRNNVSSMLPLHAQGDVESPGTGRAHFALRPLMHILGSDSQWNLSSAAAGIRSTSSSSSADGIGAIAERIDPETLPVRHPRSTQDVLLSQCNTVLTFAEDNRWWRENRWWLKSYWNTTRWGQRENEEPANQCCPII
ncbi:unnamed protein product, partial [Amoebophrya sp. A120]